MHNKIIGMILTVALSICAGPLTGPSGAVHAADRASHADTARFLAGLPPSNNSPLAALADRRSWRNHARRLDNAWDALERRQLSKIRAWRGQHLSGQQKTILYMFSGPDFLYADAFFPAASTYVLAGLEPVGREPDLANMSEGRRSHGLQHLRSSLSTILSLSFFRTKDMKVKLRRRGFRGTLPVLYAFLARAGKVVEVTEFVDLKPDGTLQPVSGNAPASGVKIDFSTPGAEGRQTLYYFSTNLSNDGLRKSGFLEFCRSHGPADSFVKSASYLLHGSYFSDARAFLLEQSRQIVQDDSGIPLKYFTPAQWDRIPFGRYAGPIRLFATRYQSDMRQLFRSNKRKPIDFGIGYRWRHGDSNLLLAIKKVE